MEMLNPSSRYFPPLKDWVSKALQSSFLHPIWQSLLVVPLFLCVSFFAFSSIFSAEKLLCCHTLAWLLWPLLCWSHPEILIINPVWHSGVGCTATRLAYNLKWMSRHHPKIDLDNKRASIHRDLSITIVNAMIVLTRMLRDLGVILLDKLSFLDRISAVAHSCRFLLIQQRLPLQESRACADPVSSYFNSLLTGAAESAIRSL